MFLFFFTGLLCLVEARISNLTTLTNESDTNKMITYLLGKMTDLIEEQNKQIEHLMEIDRKLLAIPTLPVQNPASTENWPVFRGKVTSSAIALSNLNDHAAIPESTISLNITLKEGAKSSASSSVKLHRKNIQQAVPEHHGKATNIPEHITKGPKQELNQKYGQEKDSEKTTYPAKKPLIPSKSNLGPIKKPSTDQTSATVKKVSGHSPKTAEKPIKSVQQISSYGQEKQKPRPSIGKANSSPTKEITLKSKSDASSKATGQENTNFQPKHNNIPLPGSKKHESPSSNDKRPVKLSNPSSTYGQQSKSKLEYIQEPASPTKVKPTKPGSVHGENRPKGSKPPAYGTGNSKPGHAEKVTENSRAKPEQSSKSKHSYEHEKVQPTTSQSPEKPTTKSDEKTKSAPSNQKPKHLVSSNQKTYTTDRQMEKKPALLKSSSTYKLERDPFPQSAALHGSSGSTANQPSTPPSTRAPIRTGGELKAPAETTEQPVTWTEAVNNAIMDVFHKFNVGLFALQTKYFSVQAEPKNARFYPLEKKEESALLSLRRQTTHVKLRPEVRKQEQASETRIRPTTETTTATATTARRATVPASEKNSQKVAAMRPAVQDSAPQRSHAQRPSKPVQRARPSAHHSPMLHQHSHIPPQRAHYSRTTRTAIRRHPARPPPTPQRAHYSRTTRPPIRISHPSPNNHLNRAQVQRRQYSRTTRPTPAAFNHRLAVRQPQPALNRVQYSRTAPQYYRQPVRRMDPPPQFRPHVNPTTFPTPPLNWRRLPNGRWVLIGP